MSESVKITSELEKLNVAVGMYIRAAKRGVAFAIQKQSKELGKDLAKTAKDLMPAKGAVRSERLAALKAGEGIHVRASVYKWVSAKYGAVPIHSGVMRFRVKGRLKGSVRQKGHRLNLQALAVKRELAVRESGRGFLSHAEKMALFSGGEIVQMRRIEASISRLGPQLGEFAFTTDEKNTQAVFKWGGFSKLSNEAVKAMGRSRGQAAIAKAMRATIDNMIPYLEPRLGEAAVGLLK